MKDFVIITDSCCDLPAGLADELGLVVIPLSVMIDGKQYTNYLDGREISAAKFYSLLRDGKSGTTSAVNISDFSSVMEPILQSGRDILYLGFSSALSATFSASTIAAEELKTSYPDSRIYTVDTLCASLGQGLLVYLAAMQKKSGKSIEQIYDFAQETKLRLCHWFTVEDLHHLKRGGRISSATAFVGTVLQIKPILHVDDAGYLKNVEKVRGRKASIKRLAQFAEESAVEPREQTVFISHGDCLEEAEYLAAMIRERLNVKDVFINHVGPVIGAHSGPGTLAVFFIGKSR